MAGNSTLTPMVPAKPKKGKARKPAHDVLPKDEAYDRNFGKDGKPLLNAASGGGSRAMGQRR